MATQKSNALEQAILTTFLQEGTWSGGPIEVALYTTLPGEDGSGGVEVSGTGYTRQGITFDQGEFANNGYVVSSSGGVIWSAAGSNWGTVVGIGLFDSSAVMLLYIAPLPAPITINTGDQVAFLTDSLLVTEK
jgi:hypothetical protein